MFYFRRAVLLISIAGAALMAGSALLSQCSAPRTTLRPRQHSTAGAQVVALPPTPAAQSPSPDLALLKVPAPAAAIIVFPSPPPASSPARAVSAALLLPAPGSACALAPGLQPLADMGLPMQTAPATPPSPTPRLPATPSREPPSPTPTATDTPTLEPASPTPPPTTTRTRRPPSPTPTAQPPSPTPAPAETAASQQTPTTPPQAPAPESAELASLQQQMLDAVNAERQKRGLPAYGGDGQLAGVARAHAQDMAEHHYLGHVTRQGKTLRDRLEAQGLKPGWAGENYIAAARPVGDAVRYAIRWFMGDPPHRDNILNKRYDRVGVGVAEASPGYYIFVLDFAGK